MNHKLYITLLCAALTLFWGCKSNSEAHEHEHEHTEHAHEHEGHELDEHGHEAHEKGGGFGGEIVLEPEVAEAFGVATEVIDPAPFHQVIRATGQILTSNAQTAVVAAPTDGTISFARNARPGANVKAGAVIGIIDSKGVTGGDSNEVAKVAFNQAKREYDRIKKLYDDKLATIAELNEAEAALATARAQYSPKASTGNATSPISGIITSIDVSEGQFVALGQVIATVASDTELQLRVDVPRKDYNAISSISNAIIRLPYRNDAIDLKEIGGHRMQGSAIPARSDAAAYIPVYFLVPNDGSLIPGSTFTAYLTGSERPAVMTVPVEAMIEQQGDYFVFRKIDEHGYQKLSVVPGSSDGKRIEIVSGIEPGSEIVTKGATTVRLAEASAVIPEGHSHNH